MPSSRRFTAFAALLACMVLPAGAARAAAPHVTIVSDSVLTAVTWSNVPAQTALDQNLDVQIDAGVCRRLNVQSCQFNGGYVPTALDVINGWRTTLGPVVVIVDGYNDIPASFAADVELTLDTLRDDGVQRILWVNLHEVRPEYAQKNAVLAAAALRHPELKVLDWNAYSSAHPEWYQTDYIHLVPAGGVAIAAFINQAIVNALAAPAPAAAPQPQRPALVVKVKRAFVSRVGKEVRPQAEGGGRRRPAPVACDRPCAAPGEAAPPRGRGAARAAEPRGNALPAPRSRGLERVVRTRDDPLHRAASSPVGTSMPSSVRGQARREDPRTAPRQRIRLHRLDRQATAADQRRAARAQRPLAVQPGRLRGRSGA